MSGAAVPESATIPAAPGQVRAARAFVAGVLGMAARTAPALAQRPGWRTGIALISGGRRVRRPVGWWHR